MREWIGIPVGIGIVAYILTAEYPIPPSEAALTTSTGTIVEWASKPDQRRHWRFLLLETDSGTLRVTARHSSTSLHSVLSGQRRVRATVRHANGMVWAAETRRGVASFDDVRREYLF